MTPRSVVLVAVVALGLIATHFFIGHTPPPPPQAVSDTSSIRFELATTSAAQTAGLGGRADIPHDYGMLFVFPADSTYGFWMKDMLVPIDILWLSDNGTILSILDSVATSTYPNVFYPPKPVRYVLEMRAGEAKTFGWNPGTTIRMP